MTVNYEQVAMELKGMSQIVHAIAESPFENPEALVFIGDHLEAIAKLVENDEKQRSFHEHEYE
jgi:hypothetical protein